MHMQPDISTSLVAAGSAHVDVLPLLAYVRRSAYDGVTSRINATRGRNETKQARL
jgi:hypothetical protein